MTHPNQSADLVARLRRFATPSDVLSEAAARIEHLERCRAELAGALADLMPTLEASEFTDHPCVKQARAALERAEGSAP